MAGSRHLGSITLSRLYVALQDIVLFESLAPLLNRPGPYLAYPIDGIEVINARPHDRLQILEPAYYLFDNTDREPWDFTQKPVSPRMNRSLERVYCIAVAEDGYDRIEVKKL